MKTNYSRGSVGGVILIVVGIVLCFLLLGVIVKTFRSSGAFSSNFVPSSVTTSSTGATTPKTQTTTSTNTSSAQTQNEFISSTSDCRMVINDPGDEDSVDVPIFFSGYLTGCGTVTAQMLLGSVTIYRYGTAEALAPSITLRAQNTVREGNINFSGYLNIPSGIQAEKGLIKFKHFLPDGGTDTHNVVVYF